ncbi:hypothetical protein AN396_08935 [Candidatus Epulonipiscium fishelsonii]|uniref:Uncharacterized protein n=1 Tax=Candidatus Epulonipiscium fishelsonii TaxID=77094 RepID=A0ACC8XAL3_9FIRM|nr:hypothetical protein AN396_08935 [Epulopiscium sp. SCG-B11WGA-EpuloA1]
MAAMVAMRAQLFSTMTWRIIHFGKKPVSGGRPPREKRMRGVKAVSTGFLVADIASVVRSVEWVWSNTRNAAAAITMYVSRVRRAKDFENCMARATHPRWAIEE